MLITQNIFQMILNLSRLRNKEQVINYFLKDLGERFESIDFSYLQESDNFCENYFRIEIGSTFFGYLCIESPKKIDEDTRFLINSLSQILAVILERLDFEKKIQEEKRSVEAKAEQRLKDLEKSVKELEDARHEALKSVHDLSAEIERREIIENKLIESEERYKLISDNLNDVIWLRNSELEHVFISPSIENLLGYTYQEFAKLKFEDYCTPKSLAYISLTKRKRNNGAVPEFFNGEVKLWETQFLHKNGRLVWVETKMQGISSCDGEFLGMTGVSRNIDDRKIAENAMRENEKRTRALLNAIPDLMFRFNKDGVILDYKSDSEDLYAPIESSMIGMNIDELLPAPLVKLTKENIIKTLDTKKLMIYEYQLYIDPKGNQDFEARMVPVTGTEVIATIRNITERKKTERILMESETRLRKANATKDKFFSIIAHDLRNPFSTILGACDMIAGDIKNFSYDELHFCVKSIQDSAKSTYELLENLLEWSRTQTGKFNFDPENILLEKIIVDEFSAAQKYAKSKKIKMNYEIKSDIRIFADTQMLKFVIRNLLMNAIKFTNRNGIIKISASQQKENVIVSVEDNGIGIDEDKMEKLFDISEKISTPGTEKERGTGLGLLLCKEFIEMNHGTIWVESEVDKGSKFYFTVPVESTDHH